MAGVDDSAHFARMGREGNKSGSIAVAKTERSAPPVAHGLLLEGDEGRFDPPRCCERRAPEVQTTEEVQLHANRAQARKSRGDETS